MHVKIIKLIKTHKLTNTRTYAYKLKLKLTLIDIHRHIYQNSYYIHICTY